MPASTPPAPRFRLDGRFDIGARHGGNVSAPEHSREQDQQAGAAAGFLKMNIPDNPTTVSRNTGSPPPGNASCEGRGG